jgi:hypothetical protein
MTWGGELVDIRPRRAWASLYDSTFSRTIWRLYGGAKGLAALFWPAVGADVEAIEC